MIYNHRQNESWQAASVKKRDNGQWVEITDSGGSGSSGGDGNVGQRFYTNGPPTRSGEMITYPADGHSTLQEAYESLSSDGTLIIEAGTYTERIHLDQNPTDNITITGEGNRDTTLVYPDTNEEYIIGASSISHPSDASLAAAVSGGGPEGTPTTDEIGDDRITVTDTSPFSVGDDIHIFEDRHPFDHPERPASDQTQEYNTITEIDGDDLVLETEVFLNYPNEASTAVGVMNWNVSDVRISNLDLEGDGNNNNSSTNSRLLKPNGTKHAWIDDITIRDSGGKQQAYAINCYKLRADNMDFRRIARYGWSVIRTSTHTMFTDISHYGNGEQPRYAVRFGGAGSGTGSVDGYVRGAYGTNLDGRPVVNCHYGGWWAHFEDITSEDDASNTRLRSHHLSTDTHTEINATDDSYILQNQWPTNIVFDGGGSDGDINKSDGYVFYLTPGDPRGELETYATDVTFKNFEIQAYDNSRTSNTGIDQIGYFTSSGADFRGDTVFRDIYYDGQKLQRSDIENWENYDIASIENLVVE